MATTPPPPPQIQLYAELLPNIRQISVAVSLLSPADEATVAEIANGGAEFCLVHRGETRRLKLPGVVQLQARVPGAAVRLPIPMPGPGPVQEMSWRLPLSHAADGGGGSRGDVARGVSGDAVPLSAADLQAGAALNCRTCHAVLVGNGVVGQWRDLPSENWAEMMEFWHCHKPDHHQGESHAQRDEHAPVDGQQLNGNGRAGEEKLAERGYGANSAIKARKGVGFVDLIAFMFTEDDCEGIKRRHRYKCPRARTKLVPQACLSTVIDCWFRKEHCSFAVGGETGVSAFQRGEPESWTSRDYAELSQSSFESAVDTRQAVSDVSSASLTQQSLNAFCASCQNPIGYFSYRNSSVTLFKWQVSCLSGACTSPSISQCLSATLLAMIARSGSAKSLIMPMSEAAGPRVKTAELIKVLHLWILNSDIRYASSKGDRDEDVRGASAIKLLYRVIGREEADGMLEKMTADAQEINLPEGAIMEVMRQLEDSNTLLPVKERAFKEWKVGLLERWGH